MRLLAWIALCFVALLTLFSSSTWGQLQEENTLYARGTGLFVFSLLNLLLWVAVAAMLMRAMASQNRLLPPSPLNLAARQLPWQQLPNVQAFRAHLSMNTLVVAQS